MQNKAWHRDREPAAGNGQGLRVKSALRPVRMVIADVRGHQKTSVLSGPLPIPEMLCKSPGQRIDMKIEGIWSRTPKGLFQTCPGVVTDIDSGKLIPSTVFVFPFVEEEDALDNKGRPLSHEDIVNLFLKQEPSLTLEK